MCIGLVGWILKTFPNFIQIFFLKIQIQNLVLSKMREIRNVFYFSSSSFYFRIKELKPVENKGKKAPFIFRNSWENSKSIRYIKANEKKTKEMEKCQGHSELFDFQHTQFFIHMFIYLYWLFKGLRFLTQTCP